MLRSRLTLATYADTQLTEKKHEMQLETDIFTLVHSIIKIKHIKKEKCKEGAKQGVW
jgi:hypothetical protein